MKKNLAFVALSLLVLPCILLAVACAPGSRLAQLKPLSFEAVTFTHANPGFTLQYPKTWITKTFPKEGSNTVLFVAAGEDQAADAISIFVVDTVEDYASALKNGLESLPSFVDSGAIVNIKSVIPVIMADGKTEAAEIILTSKVNTYDVWFFCYAFDMEGKTICVAGDTMGGENSKALIKEIARTLKQK